MQDRRRVIFIAKDSSFEHKHVILNLAQIESLPGVKAHFDKMLAHATMIQLGGQKVHYLCRIIWWADNIGREVESPWSEAAFCWRYFAQWRDEMITAQQGECRRNVPRAILNLL